MALTIIGAGPAGCSAAIAAALAGRRVELREKSRLPRHKVCGEFLSPEIAVPLEKLGVWDRLVDAGPARIERLSLRFGDRESGCKLDEPAFGMSRYRLDSLLLERALELGVELKRNSDEAADGPVIIAKGRDLTAPAGERGRRIFGFKAHFEGPANDAIELYFFKGGYVGVSPIEDGRTNVCGLATEASLGRVQFDFDSFCNSVPSLRRRLDGLQRVMEWMSVGPLVFRNRFRDKALAGRYLAGDALSFVDPFTGSGILAGIVTGRLAGECADMGIDPAEYLIRCRAALSKPFRAASLFRGVLGQEWAGWIAPLTSARWLYRVTRPQLTGK